MEKYNGMKATVKDGARLYIFTIKLFPQTNGLSLGMLCDMLKDLSSLGRRNWARAIHSFLLDYVRRAAFWQVRGRW